MTAPAGSDSRSAHELCARFVAGLIDHLETLREAGVWEIELDPQVLSQLRQLARDAAAARGGRGSTRPGPVAGGPSAIPSRSPEWKRAEEQLAEIAARIAACRRCPLHRTRTRTVPGQGCPQPEILFVGEGPGREEDLQGLAFVGRAGGLLTRMIRAMGLTREEVFIANIVKCRPTVDNAGLRDRPPTSEEMAACLPYLREQIAVLKPRVIVALGGTALKGLLGIEGITKYRGRWLEYEGIPVMPTYHPSYLLRAGGDQTQLYWDVWQDLVTVLERLGRSPPADRRRRS